VVRVVEIERCGPVVCPTGYGIADAPFNVGDAPYERHARLRCVQRERLDGHGEGAYRAAVHSFFILITETAGGPRSVAVLYDQESAERIIGLAIEVHRHSGPGLLQSFYAAAPCRERA
jgi:hypothetical protein